MGFMISVYCMYIWYMNIGGGGNLQQFALLIVAAECQIHKLDLTFSSSVPPSSSCAPRRPFRFRKPMPSALLLQFSRANFKNYN